MLGGYVSNLKALKMFRNEISLISSRFCRRNLLQTRNITNLDIEKLEKESTAKVEVIDEELQRREAEIEQKRNKSRLREQDRNLLLDKNPYPEPQFWYHGTLKYNRRVYGRYGAESGIDPAICWPVDEELEERVEHEKVAHPFTLQEMIAKCKSEKESRRQENRERQAEIVRRMSQLEDWKRDLQKRIDKKEQEALAAKDRKARLVEEVRAHFGYIVDPKEEKFKELLEKKEKEQKKMDKEARRQAREQNLLTKMLSKKAKENAEENKIET